MPADTPYSTVHVQIQNNAIRCVAIQYNTKACTNACSVYIYVTLHTAWPEASSRRRGTGRGCHVASGCNENMTLPCVGPKRWFAMVNESARWKTAWETNQYVSGAVNLRESCLYEWKISPQPRKREHKPSKLEAVYWLKATPRKTNQHVVELFLSVCPVIPNFRGASNAVLRPSR